MDLKGATSCGRCAGTRRVSERERASASLGPDPQASVSLLLGLQCCFWPPQVEGGRGGGGRCSHTVQALFDAFLSPHPDAGDCEHAGGAGSVFLSDPVDGASVIACVLSCVSWILPEPLVELYHWLQGEGTGGLMTSR